MDIRYKTKSLPLEKIKLFLSSFRYSVEPLPQKHEDLHKLIFDALKNHPKYSDR